MFPDRLDVSISLTANGEAFVLAAGSVRSLDVRAELHGFEARVSFVVSSEEEPDALFAPFSGTDRIDAKITIVPRPLDDPEDASDRAIAFSGLVIEREVQETLSEDLEGRPVYERRYAIVVQDPLHALWSEHQPIELHAQNSLQAVIEQHTPPGVDLTVDFRRLAEKQDVLFVPLSASRPCTFYDFVVQALAEKGGVLEHHATEATYRIGEAKKKPAKTVSLTAEEVASIRLVPPEPSRSTVHVQNPYADGHTDVIVPNAHAVTGVRTDLLEHAMVPAPGERRVETEKKKGRPPETAIRVELGQCPDHIPVPGVGVGFESEVGDARWSAKKAWRVVGLHLAAEMPAGDRAEAEDVSLEDTSARFMMELTVDAELASDPRPRLPRHRRVDEPLYVEGRVLSAGGGDTDRTWFASPNEATAVSEVSLMIPLWNKTIPVPFTPGKEPGHFFFPPFKGQRVLVELHRDRARLHAYLDWAANARTPMAAQGNRMALGLSAENGTFIDHAYVDAKPVLAVHRTLGGDEERIELRDQVVFMDVQEKPTAAAVTPKFDVTAQVMAAKLKLVSSVETSIGEVTAGFETSTAAVTGSVESAAAEVGASLEAAETKLTAKAAALRAELETLGETLGEAPARIAAAVAEAKAELIAALES